MKISKKTKESSDKIVVGLDIGTSKIKVAVGQLDTEGRIKIIGVSRVPSRGVERGAITNIRKTADDIKKAVDLASDMANVNIGSVIVGIASQNIKSKTQSTNIMLPEEGSEIKREHVKQLVANMQKMVNQPGERVIHIVPQDFTIDDQPGIKDPIGRTGLRIEANFKVVTVSASYYRNIVNCLKLNGELSHSQIILEPLASAHAVIEESERNAGVALVDIGHGSTDLAIYHDGILRHTAIIPVGGSLVTTDLEAGCDILFDRAEFLKVRHGSAWSEEEPHNMLFCVEQGLPNNPKVEISKLNLAKIIESRMEEIFEWVHDEIIASRFENKLRAGIVLTGGGAKLDKINTLLMYMTGKNVRTGIPNVNMGETVDMITREPEFATCIGLVKAGFIPLDPRDNQVDEEPDTQENQASAKEKDEVGRKTSFVNRVMKMVIGTDDAQYE